MSTDPHLTAGQRALLRERLELHRHELDGRLARQFGEAGSRALHAREVLEQDGDDAPQRAADREIELSLTDAELCELGAVGLALRRLDRGDEAFGRCGQCNAAIPFDRLQVEPWAERCVACQSAREGAAPVRPPRR